GAFGYIGGGAGDRRATNARGSAALALKDRLDPSHSPKPFHIPTEYRDVLFPQIKELRYELALNDKIKLEPKALMAKRLSRSPDQLDALIMSYGNRKRSLSVAIDAGVGVVIGPIPGQILRESHLRMNWTDESSQYHHGSQGGNGFEVDLRVLVAISAKIPGIFVATTLYQDMDTKIKQLKIRIPEDVHRQLSMESARRTVEQNQEVTRNAIVLEAIRSSLLDSQAWRKNPQAVQASRYIRDAVAGLHDHEDMVWEMEQEFSEHPKVKKCGHEWMKWEPGNEKKITFVERHREAKEGE
ncbi:MAG: hypothetical protein Q9211_007177, partial [Gyalolechia sp. 1 TL-2023]